MPLPFQIPLTNAELEANAAQIAAGILRHPGSMVLPSTAVAALVSIAERRASSASPPECRLLRGAIILLDAAEIAAGGQVAA